MHPRSAAGNTDVQNSIVLLSALLIPVLVTAFAVIYVFPDVGADYFAWPMSPLMSSMMLGATYLGGAYFFVVVLHSRQWRHVWLGFLPIAVFAATLGVATLLHWESFVHGRFGFTVWAGLYFTVPLVLPALWYRNQRRVARSTAQRDPGLPGVSRRAFGALGVVLTIAGVLLFLFPELMIPTWPWPLTPLTARVMAAIYLLPGLVGLSIAADGSWNSARYLLQAQAFSIVLMLVAVYVARADFDWGRPVSWLFAAGLLSILVLIAYTYTKRTSDTARP